MADKKISQLDTLSPVDDADYIAVVDVSANTTKKATRADFKGDKGDKGDTGATGAAGADGNDGADGADGADGESAFVYIAYASDDSGSDFTTTFDADLDYIAILSTGTEIVSPSASDFSGLWKNYKGATGLTGATGASGAAGAGGADGSNGADGSDGIDGKTVLSGSGAPDSGTGVDGDFYIDTGNHDIYGPKTSGAWGSGTSLIGPAGSGSGDMLAATYDPNSVAADAFDQDNMVDGSTNKNYTATEKTKLAGIEASADVTDTGNVGSAIDGTSAKTTPVDADTVPLIDSAASNVLKKVAWSNIKATLKTYFDGIYQTAGSYGDASTNTSSSVDGEIALFSSTGGKTLKRASGSGIAKLASGVLSLVTAPSGSIVGTSDSQTLTNKRNNPCTSSTTSTSTLTPSLSTANVYYLTAQAASLTIAAPTGTPVIGEVLAIYIKDNGTSRSLSLNSTYKAFGAALPSSTTTGKRLMLVAQYDGTDWLTTSALEQ